MLTNDTRYRFFANITEPVKTISIFIYDTTLPIADNSALIVACLGVIGLFVNFFHIFILSRKSMRQSSVNVLMIGQSICDIVCFFYETSSLPLVKNFLTAGNNECDPPISYLRVLATYSYLYLDAICRRVSPWIGVVMAAFRFFITSFPLNNTIAKLANPISSLCSILFLLVISAALSAPFYMTQTVKNTRQYVPPESCGYPANSSLAIYGVVTEYEYDEADSNIIFGWTAVFVNLPPILLPFLTTGLIRILKKYEANRAHLSGGSNEATGYHTTKLVVMMTVCLMVTEASYRISDAIIVFLENYLLDNYAIILITFNLNRSFPILYPLNSIAHCFINMMLSSEYRKIIKDLVTPKPISVRVEPRSSGSTRNVLARTEFGP